MVKKMILVLLLTMILAGCGQSAVRSEFWKHDSVYKNWDHMKFSWFGYDGQRSEVTEKATEQQWWGVEVPYVYGQ